MADQKRNESTQNQSRRQDLDRNQNETQETQGNRSDRENMDESREQSRREPASTANDRGVGSESDSESYDAENIESDLDSESDLEDSEDVEGGSNR